MQNAVISAVLLVVVGAACRYIWRAKKSGRRCIGCSSSGCCCKGGPHGHETAND